MNRRTFNLSILIITTAVLLGYLLFAQKNPDISPSTPQTSNEESLSEPLTEAGTNTETEEQTEQQLKVSDSPRATQLRERLTLDSFGNSVADVSIPNGSSRDFIVTDADLRIVTELDTSAGPVGCVSANYLFPVGSAMTMIVDSHPNQQLLHYECLYVPSRNEYLFLKRSDDGRFLDSVTAIQNSLRDDR